jgi:hypothetical protein
MSPEAREHSFDEVARGLGSGGMSRREALKWMGAALLGGALAFTPKVAKAAPPPAWCYRTTSGANCFDSRDFTRAECEEQRANDPRAVGPRCVRSPALKAPF